MSKIHNHVIEETENKGLLLYLSQDCHNASECLKRDSKFYFCKQINHITGVYVLRSFVH